MATLRVEGEMIAHVAGALRDYIDTLRDHQRATRSAAEKESYERTIGQIRALIDDLNAQA